MDRIVSRNFGRPGSHTLEVYEECGGYEGLSKALSMRPGEVTDIVKASGLRGRGGAGFPTGVKWSFVPFGCTKPVYLLVNADEGEPGTFKDREILLADPHALIEGAAIAAHAIGARDVYVYVRGEFAAEIDTLTAALEEARRKKRIGSSGGSKGSDVRIRVHRGAGAYICGEETALIESLQGRRGLPRIKPPFPAVDGLFKCPTIVQNVETLANLPHIIVNGPRWFRRWGTQVSPGMRLFSVSGHVRKPGVYELPMDVALLDLVTEHAGGLRPGRRLKAVIPGGVSTPVLRADECDVRMDFESLEARGSAAGSGGVIVMDDSACMVAALAVISRFFAHESCGQCTPCREGTNWIRLIVERLERGEGRAGDLSLLCDITKNMSGRTICVFADAAAAPVNSMVGKFREEFEEHVTLGRCPRPGVGHAV